ncbi:hypothetical protein PLEOSDRAFT_163564 [Pleurotus ostreatus PC15]|uniref:Peptidase C14 caspase domain-containing protein n=2 Tax=Pleurotus TaxID=5320 RepID=A0A067N577_PLEO1|nr:hypothetical protein CCMSSC00406_0003082 [Pleurotus cornucopiae]KDQ22989.1 hypothetical protein PLEOSDRAFT_163564 [Pleurotus ostreatus PC15]
MCSSVPNVGKRKALLIGIGEPNRPGPRNDALKVKKLLMDKYMYKKTDIVLMHDKQRIGRLMPTKDNILREIDNLVRDCQPGDRFVFHYSGHTGQQKNLDGTEVDGLDELIQTTTDPILDDVLRTRLVDPLRPGSQLVAILDSCHSATLLDLPHVDCQLSNIKDEAPKEYPRVVLADLKRPLGQCKNRLVRQPSSSKQPRAKKPRLTLDTITRSPKPSFASSGPLTSIPPQTQASSFLSPVAFNDGAPDYIKAKGTIDTSSPSTSSVDFYDREKCCNCRLTLKDESQKDKLELPRVLAISSCKDSQVSYEDGNRMTKVLCNYLRANPNPPLHRLFNDISFSLFSPAYKRAKSESWVEWARSQCRGGSRPNAYQHPSLSSLQRLNPNHKLSL